MNSTDNYNNIFISEIIINKVRHLENIRIPISETSKKHLIITGKNGSGKTSLLMEIEEYIKSEFYGKTSPILKLKKSIKQHEASLSKIDSSNYLLQTLAKKHKNQITENQMEIDKTFPLNLSIHIEYLIKEAISDRKFIFDFEQFSRINKQEKVDGPKNLDEKKIYLPEDTLSTVFSQYLTNQRMNMLNAREDNKLDEYNNLKKWFENIESIFREVFEDDTLTLQFKNETKVFEIVQNGRSAFSLDNMSAGYSAYFKIVSELLLRMNFLETGNYNISGICFIDEIETHLHIDLQNKALPLITKFFPNIQFIVTTHSPFVVNSLSNAVVYDLENKFLIEDPSKYSADAIAKTFFQADKYSSDLKIKLKRFEELSNKPVENNKDEFNSLMEYFDSVPAYFDPELRSKILDIKLKMILND